MNALSAAAPLCASSFAAYTFHIIPEPEPTSAEVLLLLIPPLALVRRRRA